MRFGKRRRSARLLSIELTPMIDVVFLLIIFFMTTARFAQMTRADVELPREKGEQQETNEEAGIIVNVDREGTIIVGGRAVALADLERIVREEVDRQRGRDPQRVKLMIRADRRTDSTSLNSIVTCLQALGLGAARIATEVP